MAYAGQRALVDIVTSHSIANVTDLAGAEVPSWMNIDAFGVHVAVVLRRIRTIATVLDSLAGSIYRLVTLDAGSALWHLFFVNMTRLVLKLAKALPFRGTGAFRLTLHCVALRSVTGEAIDALAAAASRLVDAHRHAVTSCYPTFTFVDVYAYTSSALVAFVAFTPESAVLVDASG